MTETRKITAPYKILGIENIEGTALNQFYEAMKQPFTVQGALMPDAHCGYTLPIGAVVATKGAVYPSYVGYDIGCGVCAIKTTYKRRDIEQYQKEIFERIYENIPVGFNHRKHPLVWSDWYHAECSPIVGKMETNKVLRQLGTLGGGNHFIEIGYDADNVSDVWISCHSGSRNFGHTIATEWMKLAANSKHAKEGHYPLFSGTREFRQYMQDQAIAAAFAQENRKRLLMYTEETIDWFCEGGMLANTLINRHHNHAEFDRLTGLVTHRKGATHAERDMLGVIPANMRDGVYITKGRGNPESLCSSSHGAGRQLGRAKAKRSLSMGRFEAQMSGITSRVVESTLDESPDAYKLIERVLDQQQDCLKVLKHIKPIINIKG